MADEEKSLILAKALHFPPETIQEMAKFFKIIPVDIYLLIMQTDITSGIKVVEARQASYARWFVSQTVANELKDVDWTSIMGHVRNQGSCDTCWAFVVAELISGLRFLLGLDDQHIDLSPQYLLDFACPQKAGKKSKKNHSCYKLSLKKGFEYVIQAGIEKEIYRPYVGCRRQGGIRAAMIPSLIHIDGIEMLPTIEEALSKLKTKPIGAALAIFMPDYVQIKDRIYRGPRYARSIYRGLHAVSVVGVGEENGELFFKVKSTHGESVGSLGYFKVSMHIMLVQIPKNGVLSDENFLMPTSLLSHFCCPTIIPKGC